MADVELYHFPISHFNEKARWALDFKGVAHRRHDLVPGPHKRTARRISDQEQVPILCCDGEVVSGSAQIIDHLERQHPDPPLYPEDPQQRERALEIQRWFDDELGPALRLAMFHELLQDPAYFALAFTQHAGKATQLGFRWIFPAVKGLMTREMGIDADAAKRALEVTAQGFDRVARDAGPSGHLVGDRFTVADLSAAALLFPAVLPAEAPHFPEPHAAVLDGWLSRWKDHEGAAWVRDTFARHRRGASTSG